MVLLPVPLTERSVHLCIDMQRLFSADGPWATPSARVPGDKILNALQDHQIGLDLLRPDLLFDLGVEEVTQAAP